MLISHDHYLEEVEDTLNLLKEDQPDLDVYKLAQLSSNDRRYGSINLVCFTDDLWRSHQKLIDKLDGGDWDSKTSRLTLRRDNSAKLNIYVFKDPLDFRLSQETEAVSFLLSCYFRSVDKNFHLSHQGLHYNFDEDSEAILVSDSLGDLLDIVEIDRSLFLKDFTYESLWHVFAKAGIPNGSVFRDEVSKSHWKSLSTSFVEGMDNLPWNEKSISKESLFNYLMGPDWAQMFINSKERYSYFKKKSNSKFNMERIMARYPSRSKFTLMKWMADFRRSFLSEIFMCKYIMNNTEEVIWEKFESVNSIDK